MLAKVFSIFPYGLEGKRVEVEVQIESGLRSFTIVGLPDEAIREAVNRVSLALRNSGFISPSQLNKKVTVNLAPADVKKQGSYFDLAIAIGFLTASAQIPKPEPADIFFGELSLDGRVLGVRGALALIASAHRQGFTRIFFSSQNAREGILVRKIEQFSQERLGNIVELLRSPQKAKEHLRISQELESAPKIKSIPLDVGYYDFSEINGQETAKRALEIAAAGGHHALLMGPPGAGKSILARAFTSLLPELTPKEAIEVGIILSITGSLESPLIAKQFRAPHHTASAQALLGGGNPIRPGEITLAHKGVLFLDEFPEFHRDALEALRQPLESRVINVARSSGNFTFPAAFQLIAAANPCPCGFKDDTVFACICTPGQLSRYNRKLSGPLTDRIDLWAHVPRLTKEELLSKGKSAESSSHVHDRVQKAREIQRQRFGDYSVNSAMTLSEIKKFCVIDDATQEILGKAIEQFGLSARGYHKILKVSRTIADLGKSEDIKREHVLEALQYRKQNTI